MASQTPSRRERGMTLYGIFVGVLVTLVLGIATTAAFPRVTDYQPDHDQLVSLYRMIMSLVTSLLVLAAGLFLPIRWEFLRLGLLLAAVANLVLGNAFAWDYDNDWVRLLAAALSLAVAVGAGLVQFGRRSDGLASTPDHPLANDPIADPTTIEARLQIVERRLAGAAAALGPGATTSASS